MSTAEGPERLLFVGTHGHVLALEKTTGQRVWERSLPRTGYSVVSIVYEDGALYCASGGRVFALDPATGDVRWENYLPGMGSGLVYLTTMQSNDTEAVMATLAAQVEQRRRAASGGGAG